MNSRITKYILTASSVLEVDEWINTNNIHVETSSLQNKVSFARVWERLLPQRIYHFLEKFIDNDDVVIFTLHFKNGGVTFVKSLPPYIHAEAVMKQQPEAQVLPEEGEPIQPEDQAARRSSRAAANRVEQDNEETLSLPQRATKADQIAFANLFYKEFQLFKKQQNSHNKLNDDRFHTISYNQDIIKTKMDKKFKGIENILVKLSNSVDTIQKNTQPSASQPQADDALQRKRKDRSNAAVKTSMSRPSNPVLGSTLPSNGHEEIEMPLIKILA